MLENFKSAILAIANTNKVEESIGLNMFVANINKGKPDNTYWYGGADHLVNFMDLKTEWDCFTISEKAEEIEKYNSKIG